MPELFPITLSEMATCHAGKPAYCRGLCRACYDKRRWAAKPHLREKRRAYSAAYGKKYYQERGAEKRAAYRREYAERGHVWKREEQLALKYKITPRQFDAMMESQDGVCAICRLPPKDTSRRTKYLCVDHNPETHRVRGLLCYACNAGIGMLAHDVSVLAAAIRYLERTNG